MLLDQNESCNLRPDVTVTRRDVRNNKFETVELDQSFEENYQRNYKMQLERIFSNMNLQSRPPKHFKYIHVSIFLINIY